MINRCVLVCLSFTIFFSSALSEVNQRIEDYVPKFTYQKREWYRPFIGTVNISSLPSPLKETKVDFHLFIPETITWIDQSDWIIKLNYSPGKVKLLTDSIFTWYGPHEMGGVFNGTFTFVPMASGFNEFTIYQERSIEKLSIRSKLVPGLKIGWCLDENGDLQFLGNPQFKNIDCYPLKTHYFANDTVYVSGEQQSNDLFDYEIRIYPIPRIDDITTLHFKMMANTDLPDGVDLRIDAYNGQLVSFPENLGASVYKGETVEFQIQYIPMAVASGQKVILQFSRDFGNKTLRAKDRQQIACIFQFNDSGRLRFVNNQAFRVPERYIPTSLPVKTVPKLDVVIIHSKEHRIERF